MYIPADSDPRKNSSKEFKNSRLIWYFLSIFSWSSLLFFAHEQYGKIDILLLITVMIGVVFLIGILQNISIHGLLGIYPYWIIIVVLGFLGGFIWIIMFLGSLFGIMLGSAILTTSLANIVGETISTTLTIFVIPTTYSLVFLVFTYGIWYKFLKPMHNSNRMTERSKLLLEGIVAIAVSLFISLSLYVAFSVIFASNFLIATLLSSLPFSILSYSGFKEIYEENAIFNVFKIKNLIYE